MVSSPMFAFAGFLLLVAVLLLRSAIQGMQQPLCPETLDEIAENTAIAQHRIATN